MELCEVKIAEEGKQLRALLHCHAREAGGTIHSDIERGFVRAEVVACQALLEPKTLAHWRDKGLLRLAGREYEVADGDVINFPVNV